MDNTTFGYIERFSFSQPLPALIFLSVFLAAISYCSVSAQASPQSDSVPWVGLQNEWFQITRAHLRDARKGKEYLKEGYEKVSMSSGATRIFHYERTSSDLLPRSVTDDVSVQQKG